MQSLVAIIEEVIKNGDNGKESLYAWFENEKHLLNQIANEVEIKTLKIVWPGYHYDFDVISPPTAFDGTLVVHVSNMNEFLRSRSTWGQNKDQRRGVRYVGQKEIL